MKAAIFIFCVLLEINNYFVAGATCTIEGLKKEENLLDSYYKIQIPIVDTHSGVIASFQTKNILRMKIENVNYLNATWENQVLTFFVTDAYKNYEKESKYSNEPEITVTLNCLCTQDTSENMIIRQTIVDINNHPPILNEKRYDYVFGMTVPEKLKLTEILPIKVNDIDVSNSEITFTIPENPYFKLDKEKVSSQNKQYTTTLIVAKNLTAPLSEEFTLTVTDNGHPVKNTTVPLTIAVMSPQELEKNQDNKETKDNTEEDNESIHPPVFAKHLYFADYNNNHQFTMEEPIVIAYGAQTNTKLKQLGYEEYFNIDFEDPNHKTIIVKNTKALPNQILENIDMITIEIEATNEGLSIAGQTSLLIRLPKLGQLDTNVISEENSQECDIYIKYGYFADTYTIPFILFLLAVFGIVFTNVYIIIMFINKSKTKR
ncbi:hypothetical protein ILUMI_04122, partial [Ignelater luminosus]